METNTSTDSKSSPAAGALNQLATPPPGWYRAQGDPPDTQRFWDGTQWQGGPQPIGTIVDTARARSSAMPLGLEAGNPWLRIGAKVIDQTLLPAFFVGVTFLFEGLGAVSGEEPEALYWILLIPSFMVYNLVMVGFFATTVGKAMVGLRVVGPTGQRAGWVVATRRWVLQLVVVVPFLGPLAVLGIALVSLVYLFTDPRRQTVHDRVAGSFVVTTESLKRTRTGALNGVAKS